jgi:excinuclease ABC subunit C
VPVTDKNLSVTVPKIGEKRKLLELSLKNVQYYRAQKKRDEASKTKRQTPAERILRTLQADLQMNELPMHIECFDNSNIQGTNPVSSCVVFKNAKPSKPDYRHFKVKTVVGPNDFDTMKEVVFRRYRRLLEENQPLPQLVIIDGGKGQLGAAMESIVALGLAGKMTVIGIAKRLEEIFFPGDSVPLYINKKSESLKLIQQARNEAHRFAITFHRDLRSKQFIETELNNIPGIGEKTAQKLLTHFGSVRKVREALASELIEVLGMAKAKVVKDYFDH